MTREMMEFPETFDEFVDSYGFIDTEEVYTNGSQLISVFRVKQWLEHDNKLRTIETDTAYECGKHANKWIPVSERLPEEKLAVLVWCPKYKNIYCAYCENGNWWIFGAFSQIIPNAVKAWQPLPEPYKAESEEKI